MDYCEELKCCICIDILREPRQCVNGHLYCAMCIAESFKFKLNCPICNCDITKLYQNLAVECLLEKKVVKCCNNVCENSCTWTGYDHDYGQHLLKCPYQYLNCTNGNCREIFQRRYQLRHLSRCPKKLIVCQYCGLKIHRYDFNDHVNQECYYVSSCIKRPQIPTICCSSNNYAYKHKSRLTRSHIAYEPICKSTHIIKSVAWSSDNQYAAYSSGSAVTVYNMYSGLLMNTIIMPTATNIDTIAWCNSNNDSEATKWNIALASGYIVGIFHALSSRAIQMIISDTKVNRVSWSNDNTHIVTCGNTRIFNVWNIATGQMVYTLKCEYAVKCVAWSPSGLYIASGCERIRIWNARTGSLVNLFTIVDTNGPFCIDWSPCSSYVVCSTNCIYVTVWDVSCGSVLHILEGHCDNITTVKWSPDGLFIASGSVDKTIRIWDASTGTCMNILKGHDESVNCITFSGDSDYLMSGSNDKQLLLW